MLRIKHTVKSLSVWKSTATQPSAWCACYNAQCSSKIVNIFQVEQFYFMREINQLKDSE